MSENRLTHSTSPYLLQHKDNPVHWQSWGPAAFAQAASEGKPILLSVGYAACHWCHVMAHESFENPEIAGLMNALYVNIKVDREERPDVDAIYQQALALLGQQGGWPLTMFLTPAGEPFWGGTYFPPTERWGRPGFDQVLRSIAAIYEKEKDKVASNVTAIKEALQRLARPQTGGDQIRLDHAMTDRIAERLLEEVDLAHGGIGSAPKFPQEAIFELFWRCWKRTANPAMRDAVLLTLNRMAQGGIYDHLGGGWSRYSVDAEWLVPHFEKMLYDNALLIEQYASVWQESGDRLFAQRVEETIGWLLREMRVAPGPSGKRGFASSYDADSEHVEGKFYVWSEAEIDELLGPDSALFKRHYDVTAEGNWEHQTILNRSRSPESDPASETKLAAARQILFARRALRIKPGWDDKALADWNGLAIAALAFCGRVFDRADWIEAAIEAHDFVMSEMMRDGRLRHSYRAGRLDHPATLDDYANNARGALALYEATGEARFLARARELVSTLDRHYWDEEGGGYFFTADDTADLILRSKQANDNAVPSGNGTMLGVLARLYYLSGEAFYRDRAERLQAAFAGELTRNFFPLASFVNQSELLRDAVQLVLVGALEEPEMAAMKAALAKLSLPNLVLQSLPPGAELPTGHPAAGKTKPDLARKNRVAAFVCRGQTCSLPIYEPAGLAAALQTRPL